MATVSSTLKLLDGFSSPLTKVISAVESTINAMDALANEVDKPNRVADAFNEARKDISLATMEIEQSVQEMDRLNNKTNQTNNSFSGLASKAKQIIGSLALIKSGQEFIGNADAYTSTIARLNLINDGLQSTDELNQKIFQSAQRARSAYSDTADIIGKLGMTASDAFTSNDEMIFFSETMAKSFKIAGASATEQSAAMYQLTQAMAAGRLQGDEFRSISENAPMLAQAIADIMGVSRGELKELSAEGAITSDIIKAAIFNSADEINEKFEQMPMTFNDVVSRITNSVSMKLQPSFQRFSNFINSVDGQKFITTIGNGISFLIVTGGHLFNIVTWIASAFIDNWSFIAPIIFTVITALLILKGATIAYNIVKGVTNFLEQVSAARAAIHAGASLSQAAAVTTATGAQAGLNAALLACPITWILLIIIAVIGVIWILINTLNEWGISTGEIVGSVIGAFSGLLAHIQNVFIYMGNYIGAFINFFGNVFTDPIGAIKMLFLDLTTNVIEFIYQIAEALEDLINKIPGVEVNMTEGLNNVLSMIEDAKEAIENETGVTSFEPIEFKSISESYAQGAEWGEDKFNDMASKFDNLKESLGYSELDFNSPFEVATSDFDSFNVDTVGSIDEDVNISEEDIELLRDIATMEAVNQYATLAPNIKVEFTGDINETADVDKVAKRIEEILEEQIAVSAELAYS